MRPLSHFNPSTLHGWRAQALSYLAGALLSFAFAPFQWWPVLFACLPVFYLLLNSAPSARVAAWRGFFFGYGYFMAGTWWIANALAVDMAKFGWMIPLCVLGLSAVLALYFALLGGVYFRLRGVSPYVRFLRFSVLWVLVEYLRSVGPFGFPWNLLGYSALASLPVAQIASVVGTFGLGFLVVVVAVWPVVAPVATRRMVLPVLLLAALYGYGAARIADVPLTPTRLRIVQPNIAQAIKGTAAGAQEAVTVLGRLNQSGVGTLRPDLIVWPETAYPFTLRAQEPAMMGPGQGTLVTGAVRAEGAGASLVIFNSVVALDATGAIRAQYDKHQLVPFGEFVPLRSVLPLEKITPGDIDFSRGPGPQTIALPGLPSFSPLVCYEAIFPWAAADPSHRPQLLINVTNDGWYGDSPGPYQHLAMARMRAIEQGIPLVRAANNGVSALVDPYGRVVAALALDVRGVLDVIVPAALPVTPYAGYGEWLIFSILVTFFVSSYLFERQKK